MVLPKIKSRSWSQRNSVRSVIVFVCLGVALLVSQLNIFLLWSLTSSSSPPPQFDTPRRIRHYPKPHKVIDRHGPMPLAQSSFATLDHLEITSQCVPMHSWQTTSYFSCNKIHDLDYSELRIINCGKSRCAFSTVDHAGFTVTLKMQIFDKEITPSRYNSGRKDSLAMERLTSSPYIANIYGNCGLSQLTEFSQGGNLHDLIKRSRLGDEKFRELTPLTKLKIAYQLTSAVADLHSIENDRVASLAHNDICCHQYIIIDGMFKLNDFHLSVFIEKSPTTGLPCVYYPFFSSDLIKLRAPEEGGIVHRSPAHADMVDVYMLGDVLYYLHTNLWMFEGLSNREANIRSRQGERSPLPTKLLISSDTSVKALNRAIHMCWTHDPQSRPRARQIADYLKERLRLEGVDVDGPIRVSIPALPQDHRYTDSDYYDNLSTP